MAVLEGDQWDPCGPLHGGHQRNHRPLAVDTAIEPILPDCSHSAPYEL